MDFTSKVKAVINEKDVMSDALFESLFDDGIYVQKENYAMGLFHHDPLVLKYHSNSNAISVENVRDFGSLNGIEDHINSIYTDICCTTNAKYIMLYFK
jgi:hypothetical protein